MTEEVSIVPAPEVAPAATGDAGELPCILTGQQAEKPVRPAISKRKRSYIDRVFGNKKTPPPEQSKASPKTEMAEAPIEEPVIPAAPLEVAEIPTAQPQVQEQPAASIDELDGRKMSRRKSWRRRSTCHNAKQKKPTLEISAPEAETRKLLKKLRKPPKRPRLLKRPKRRKLLQRRKP